MRPVQNRIIAENIKLFGQFQPLFALTSGDSGLCSASKRPGIETRYLE
jgi:hypothetical protein